MSEPNEGWIAPGVYRDARGPWYTIYGAQETFGLPPTSVIRWREKPCRYRDGQFIDTRQVPRRIPLCRWEEVTVYFGPHLEEVRDRRLAAIARQLAGNPTPLATDATERPYLTEKELFDRFEIGEGFCQHWSHKRSKVRPGEKALRRRTVWNDKKATGRSRALEYCVADVRAILRGDESDRPDLVGSLNARAEAFRRRIREAEAWLAESLAKGPRLATEIDRLARLADVTRGCLRAAKRNLKVRLGRPRGVPGGPGWFCLPGQPVPVAKGLSKVRAAILQLVRTKGPLTTKQVAKVIRKAQPAVKFHLIALRKDGLIEGGSRTKRDVWFWHTPKQHVPEKSERFSRPAMDQVLHVLRERGPLSRPELACAIKKKDHATEELLRRLKREGLVSVVGGKYAVVAQRPAPQTGAGAAPSASDRTKKHGGGRRASEETAKVYEFCYDEYRVKGRKRGRVLQDAQAKFPKGKAPGEERDVTLYANRHADRNGLPRNPPTAAP